LSVTVLWVMLAAPPVVTAGLAALAVAGASSASDSTNNMTPRNIVPPVRRICPIHARQHGEGANVSPPNVIS
jgi:hypothetical protein